jgi:hypothetical protein
LGGDFSFVSAAACKYLIPDLVAEVVGRRDFQRVWEGGKAGFMAFHAFHTLLSENGNLTIVHLRPQTCTEN